MMSFFDNVNAGNLSLVFYSLIFFSVFIKASIILGILSVGFGFRGVLPLSVATIISAILSFNVSINDFDKIGAIFDNNDKQAAYQEGVSYWKGFLEKHSKSNDSINNVNEDQSISTLTSNYLSTQLKEAFSFGLVLLLPFIVIDLAVLGISTLLGIESYNPLFISMPIKLLLFISVDGWALVFDNFFKSFNFV